MEWCEFISMLFKLSLKGGVSNVLSGIATNVQIWKVMSHNVPSQCHAMFDIMLCCVMSYYVGSWRGI